jgi:murein L,D-transpeptidase YcbB/YkuD
MSEDQEMSNARARRLTSSRVLVALTLIASVTLGACRSDPTESRADPHDPTARIRALLEGASAPVLVAVGDTVHLGERTVAFYARRGFHPAWTDQNGFLPQGEALIGALHGTAADGLEPRQYHQEAVNGLMERVLHDHERGFPVGDLLGNLDILLTEAFTRYARDLVSGSVDPDSAGLPWLIPKQDSTDNVLLASLLERPDLTRALDELRPAVPFYDHLRAALPRYQTIADRGGWPSVSGGDALELGSTGERVVELRRRLRAEGDPVEAALLSGDGQPARFDSALVQAVTHFQERHGIDADGRVGEETLEELNAPVEERLLALKLNMDRWRWLPRELGDRYVLVNVAGYELAVVEQNEPVLRMNVVVGKDGWTTPFFHDSIEFVVVNPYWNVPPSIVERDLVPAVRRDPGYLARNGYEVLTSDGGRVDASGVDIASNSYTIRQRPGADNALGEVKFVFPNSMNIYLHDTPARHLFELTKRTFSSGCIRVEKPRELAEYLLRTATTMPVGTYDSLRATERERWVKLDEKIPIYILYFTAWADGDGSVRFYPDVYRRDRAILPLALAELGAPSSRVATPDLTGNQESLDR